MDVLNRIKSAVSSALPVGNPITGEFEILAHRASGGPGLLWKIYDGIQKSTKQEASVFLFEKKNLERFHKAHREILLEVLKKGVSQLTRLRHPKILSVLHPLEDSRESLAFATEPVFSSLSNLLGFHDNIPTPAPAHFKDFTFYDVEIKYGLLQMLDGLNFLHSSVKMIHGNICPESIYVNKTGCWKLAGFEFCINNSNQQGLEAFYKCREWDASLTPVAQAKLNYLAPEYVLTECDTSSDMYSVGLLIYALHSGGKTVYDSMDDWTIFKKNAEQMKSLGVARLSGIPDGVKDHVKMLLNTEPAVRPDTDQLAKIPYFEDVGAMTLQYLDMLVQKDNLQKSQFFKGLPSIIANLPKRVNLQRVLPSLSKECVNNNMVPFVLPCLLQIAETTTDEEYSSVILPALIPLFKITEPIQVMLILLQNMTLLLNKTPQADIRNHILPMITRALEAGIPQMQELCLNIIPTFAELIEYTSLKNSIVPKIRKLCVGAPTLSIRVNCLVCIGKLLEHLDKWYVLDEVLPILLEIPTREPAVLMSVLGILRVMLTHKKLGITKELLANKVIPFVFPLCIDNGLNLAQFNTFMATVKDMVNRVETEQRAKLEQLNAVQTEQRTLQKFAEEAVSGTNTSSLNDSKQPGASSMMDSFLSDMGMGVASSGVSVKGSSVKQLSEATSANNTSSTTTNNKKAGGGSLTMAEKEKLAKEQELQKQLKSQPALIPSSTSSAAQGHKATDLSYTLKASMFPTEGKPLTANQPSINLSSLDSVLPSLNQNKPSLNQIKSTGSGPIGGGIMGGGTMGGGNIGGGIMSGRTMGGGPMGGGPMGGGSMGGGISMGGGTMGGGAMGGGIMGGGTVGGGVMGGGAMNYSPGLANPFFMSNGSTAQTFPMYNSANNIRPQGQNMYMPSQQPFTQSSMLQPRNALPQNQTSQPKPLSNNDIADLLG